MASESYYFILSVLAVVICCLYFINLVWLQMRRETIVGEAYEPSKPGYEKFRKLSSKRSILIVIGLTALFIANLIYGIDRLLELGKPEYAQRMLTFTPAAIILFITIMILIMRDNRKANKHD